MGSEVAMNNIDREILESVQRFVVKPLGRGGAEWVFGIIEINVFRLS